MHTTLVYLTSYSVAIALVKVSIEIFTDIWTTKYCLHMHKNTVSSLQQVALVADVQVNLFLRRPSVGQTPVLHRNG